MRVRLDHLDSSRNEFYNYDALDRLTRVSGVMPFGPDYQPAGLKTETSYDAVGNITFKTGLGDYSYDGPRPHAVTGAGGGEHEYDYDSNGNQKYRRGPSVKGGQQTLVYNDFGLPASARVGTGAAQVAVDFDYDATGRRVRELSAERSTLYFGQFFQRVTKNTGEVEHRARIFGPTREIAQVVKTETSSGITTKTVYLHANAVGTPEVLTNDAGLVAERQSVDAFGAPQDGEFGGSTGVLTGFTGHQQDSVLGLVDAQGRMYDSASGRFLSPDPVIQAPFSSQGLNAYSYAFNNPINVVDPSGLEGKWQQVYGAVDEKTGAFDATFVDNNFNEVQLVVFDDTLISATAKSPTMAVTQAKPAEAKEQAQTEQAPTNDQADTEKNTQPSQPGSEAPKPATSGGTAAGGQAGSAGGGNKGSGRTGGGGKPRPSNARAVAAGASGAALGLGMGLGTMYATGAAGSLLCGPAAPACAAAVATGITAAFVGAAIYQLWNGGAAQIGDAAQRLGNGEGTEDDYFLAGSIIGGVVSGGLARPSMAGGAGAGLRARAILTGGGRGVTRFLHGTTEAGAESAMAGLKPVSTSTGSHPPGSFFTHEATAPNALEGASHWPVVQGKVPSTGVRVIEMTVPN
ncbi:MAG TPA: RHS repeat-associated core domain-containing protein, partial [Polyangiaceae bacterium]